MKIKVSGLPSNPSCCVLMDPPFCGLRGTRVRPTAPAQVLRAGGLRAGHKGAHDAPILPQAINWSDRSLQQAIKSTPQFGTASFCCPIHGPDCFQNWTSKRRGRIILRRSAENRPRARDKTEEVLEPRIPPWHEASPNGPGPNGYSVIPPEINPFKRNSAADRHKFTRLEGRCERAWPARPFASNSAPDVSSCDCF